MEYKNPKHKILIVVGISLILVVSFIIVWLINKNKPFLSTILWYLIFLSILAIFGGVVFLIVWLFKKQKTDLLYVMKNQIIDSCKINEPDQKTPIFLYNNKDSKYLGQFQGFSMIKTSEWMTYIDDKNKDEHQFMRNFLKIDQNIEEKYIYIIAFKPKTGKTQLILALEQDFNSLTANPVIFFGEGLSPKMYEFVFLSKHYDIAEKIELPVKNLVNKYALEHNMREMVNIIDNAIDIDASFRKAQEKSNIDDFRPDAKQR